MSDTLTSILNLEMDDRAWSQGSLPVRFGGLGVRKISCVALPAFLSLAYYSTSNIVVKILEYTGLSFEIPYVPDARKACLMACPNNSPATALS